MKTTRLITTTVVVTIFTTLFSYSGRSFAQQSRFEYPPAYKSVTWQEESTLGRTVIVALRHIAQARSDIHRKELTSARIDLDRAEKLLDTTEDDLSTSDAKNFIRIARKHLEYEQPRQVLHDLPEIYSSLETISVYIPTDKAKTHVDRAKGFLEKDKKQEAEKELARADNSLIVIEVDLPLLNAKRFINRAQEYLDKNEPGKADEALKKAEHRAMDLYSGMTSPLIQTKRNIWLAFRNYTTAKNAETMSRLDQARIHLGKAQVAGNVKGNEEAGKLSSEISELEKKLAGGGKVAESDLKAAWEKSEALAERAEAYLSAGLSEAETTLGMESNLIEARLHVRYAETYQITTSEPDKAVKELELAYSYLQKAAGNTLADSSERRKIHEISTIILVLKQTPKENDRTVQDRYDTVREEIRDLTANEKEINQVRSMQGM
ncbi:MAG: YfdX family protein [Desulfobacteraceae bacterium]|nr:YfdX family protein [Desulfobacteraceae bacterium]